MRTLKISIPIAEDEKVSGVVAIPADFQKGKTLGVILAHGAANDMENPLIVFLSNGLAEAGFLSLRFNFPYKEKGRKAPDSQKKLVQTWQQVFHFLKDNPKFGTKKSSWDLEVIDGGDHSLGLSKSADRTQDEVYAHVLRTMVDWIKTKINPSTTRS